MKIKVGCAMDMQGARREDEIEVDEESTPEEIDAEVREWALQHFEWWRGGVSSAARERENFKERTR